MGTRSRINRNRRKRVHAAELRRHEMDVDGAPPLPRTDERKQARPGTMPAVREPDRAADRETEERQWRATWEVGQS